MSTQPTLEINDRKPRADSLRNHELILLTARRLFDEHGVNNITMSAVADAAAIGKGTLYRHFPDKSELIFALIGNEADALRTEVLERCTAHETPRDTLHWFAEQALGYALRNNSLLCEATNHSASASLVHPSRAWWRDVMTGLFADAGVSCEPSYAADTVYMMLDAQTLYFQQATLGYSPERLNSNLHALIDSLLAK